MTVNGVSIEPSTYVKYLGLLLDEFLRFNYHIDNVCAKVAPKIGILKKLKSFIPSDILLVIYYAFIHPHFNYIVGVWGSASVRLLNAPQVLQNRALKHVYKLPFRFSTNELYFEKYHVPNLKCLYYFNICNFVYNVINDYSYHTIQFPKFNHSFMTRNKDCLILPKVRTTVGQRSISFIGPLYFNNLPIEIVNCNNHASFKKQLKKYLRENLRPP